MADGKVLAGKISYTKTKSLVVVDAHGKRIGFVQKRFVKNLLDHVKSSAPIRQEDDRAVWKTVGWINQTKGKSLTVKDSLGVLVGFVSKEYLRKVLSREEGFAVILRGSDLEVKGGNRYGGV